MRAFSRTLGRRNLVDVWGGGGGGRVIINVRVEMFSKKYVNIILIYIYCDFTVNRNRTILDRGGSIIL